LRASEREQSRREGGAEREAGSIPGPWDHDLSRHLTD